MGAGKPITYGDDIVVPLHSPLSSFRGKHAAVCGVRQLSTEQARALSIIPDTTVVLIEFGDGTSIEVPETWIQLAPL